MSDSRSCLKTIAFFAILTIVSFACRSKSKDGSNVASAGAGLSGKGVARFHLYGDVGKCNTALGLDPKAFGMMVVAASTRIHDQLPKLLKVGKRKGPYDNTARCVQVTSVESKASIQVRIIDKCCGESLSDPTTHQLDLSQEAFTKLASPDKGRLDITWKVIDCPDNLQVKNDDAVCNDDYYYNL